MIYRTTTLEDVDAICRIYDKERLEWPAYYPPLPPEVPTMFIEASHKKPKDFFTLAVDRDKELVGYISMHTHYTFGLKTAENIGIFVDNNILSPMESVCVLRNMIRRTHWWAFTNGCRKVVWMVTIGKWKSLQTILARERCSMVGVNMEFNYGTWRTWKNL